MWADALLDLERGHVVRLALWGGACALLGTLVVALLVWRRTEAPFLKHFAIQTGAWGAVDVVLAIWAWRGLALRDFAGAQRLVNFLWLNTGLDIGYVMLGVTLAIAGWRMGARLGSVGAGVGILLQGVALALLDIRLIALIGPLQ